MAQYITNEDLIQNNWKKIGKNCWKNDNTNSLAMMILGAKHDKFHLSHVKMSKDMLLAKKIRYQGKNMIVNGNEIFLNHRVLSFSPNPHGSFTVKGRGYPVNSNSIIRMYTLNRTSLNQHEYHLFEKAALYERMMMNRLNLKEFPLHLMSTLTNVNIKLPLNYINQWLDDGGETGILIQENLNIENFPLPIPYDLMILVQKFVGVTWHLGNHARNKLAHAINGNTFDYSKIMDKTLIKIPIDQPTEMQSYLMTETDFLNSNKMEIDYDVSAKGVIVKYKAPNFLVYDDRSFIGTMIEIEGNEREVTIERTSLGKIVHETVCAILSSKTSDQSFKEISLPPYDPNKVDYLKLTPDFFFNSEGEINALELGTLQNARGINTSFRNKMIDLKRKIQLNELEITPYVLIVSPTSVVANFHIQQADVNLLCDSCRLGIRALIGLEKMHAYLNNEDKTAIREDFEDKIHYMDLPFQAEVPIISREFLSYCQEKLRTMNELTIKRNILEATIISHNESIKQPVGLDMLNIRDREFREALPKPWRNDNKSPFQVPLVLCGEDSADFCEREENPYCRLWSQIVYAPEEESEMIAREEDPEWKATSHRTFGKVKFDIHPYDKTYFAKKGVWGKKFSQEADRSKMNFSPDTDTEDIDLAFRKEWARRSEYDDKVESITEDLINMSAEKESEVDKRISEFKNTILGNISYTLSLLYQELNNDIQKKCKTDEFIYKKVKNTGISYLAKPTGTHLFFSVKTSCKIFMGSPFLEPEIIQGDLKIFPFVSTNRNRISTMLNCFENLCVLYADLKSHYPKENSKIYSKLVCAFMMMCENRQPTADMLYRVRQVTLKCASGSEEDPFNLMKSTESLRSRFAVWIYKRTKKATEMMIKDKPYLKENRSSEADEDSNEGSIDNFGNLIDLITLKEEKTIEMIVYTSYLASFHSPGTMDKMMAESKVVSKIAKYELMMRDARKEHMGWGSLYSGLRMHEFNLEVSLYCGSLVRKRLELAYGKDTDEMIRRQFAHELSTPFLDFATFKASLLRRTDLDYKAPNKKLKTTKSVKAIETVMKSFDDYYKAILSPAEDMEMFLSALLLEIQSKLDKKMDQPTGLREILTKLMEDRYIFKPMEKLAEWMNSFSPYETLSKGSKKDKMFDNMMNQKVLEPEDGFVIFVLDQILDHEKWCQQFVMTKFYSHFVPILPPEILKYFGLLMNAVTNKKIILSNDLLKKFTENVKFYDKAIEELKEQFMGTSKFNDLLDSLRVDMKNTSNFGQGWMHNVSSSDGDSNDILMNEMLGLLMKVMIRAGELPNTTQMYFSALNSSDDKSKRIYLKVEVNHVEHVNKFFDIGSEFSIVIPSLTNKSISGKKSVKKMKNKINEYNQGFRIGNSSFIGYPKFINASIQIPVTTNMNDRMSNFSNTRRNLPENGFDLITTAVCQRMQARLHYRSLGAGISSNFAKFKDLLIENPSSSLGFFPLEPDRSVGLGGNQYAEYLLLKTNKNASQVKKALISNSEIMMGVHGDIGPSVSFRITKNERYVSFRRRHPENAKMFDHIPDLLYREAESRQETEMLLNWKASTPGAELAFVYDSTPKMMSGSSMFLTEPIQRIKIGEEIKKVNTMALVSLIKKGDELTNEDLISMFPNFQIYEAITNIVSPDILISLPCNKLAYRTSIFYMDTLKNDHLMPLIDCVKTIWFGLSTKHSSTVIRDSFKYYKILYPWLEDTHEKTMNGFYKFESAVSLHGTIMMLSSKETKVSFKSPIRQAPVLHMFRNFTKYIWKRDHLMISNAAEVVEPDSFLTTTAARILTGPFSHDEKLYYLETLNVDESLRFGNRSQKNLLLLTQILKNSPKATILANLLELNGGQLSYYMMSQKKVNDKWIGNCMIMLIVHKEQIQIDFIGGKITIICSDKLTLTTNKKRILSIIKRNFGTEGSVDSGQRFGEMGFGKGVGYDYKLSKIKINIDLDRLIFDVNINKMGKVFIYDVQSKPTILHTFYISYKDLTSLESYDHDAMNPFQKEWMNNAPSDLSAIKMMINVDPTWMSSCFNLSYTYKFGSKRILADNNMDFIEEESYDSDINEEINVPFNDEDFGLILENYNEDDTDNPENEFTEITEHIQNYTDIIPISTLQITRIFDKLYNSISKYDHKAFFNSERKLGYHIDDDDFKIFLDLIDYWTRDSCKVSKTKEMEKIGIFYNGYKYHGMRDQIFLILGRIPLPDLYPEGITFVDTRRNVKLTVKLDDKETEKDFMMKIAKASMTFFELTNVPLYMQDDIPVVSTRHRAISIYELLENINTHDEEEIKPDFIISEEEFPSLGSRKTGTFYQENPLYISNSMRQKTRGIFQRFLNM